MEYIEEAKAKINLTLNIVGRLDNGYHALHSLVGFAKIYDRIKLIPKSKVEIKVEGPFAIDLQGQNLLEKVIDILRRRYPQLVLGEIILEKNLPVASGIGGGSADAAALLRAIQSANKKFKNIIPWLEIARELGADVPVCFESRTLWMTGIGHTLHELKKNLPPLALLLVNPMVPVPKDKTIRIFKLLNTKLIKKEEAEVHLLFPEFDNKKDLLRFIEKNTNDLYPAALQLIPEISTVLNCLRGCLGLEIASLSGAGPTCYGIFESFNSAELARSKLEETYPTWWIKSGALI